MAQELLIKQERNGWAVILRALAEASTNSASHMVTANTLGIFQLDEMNRLMTLLRRMNTSWAAGTPTSLDSYGLTDLFVSPEVKEQIRAFAYNPMNTTAGVTPAGGTASTVGIPLPEPMRQQIYNSAGLSEIYGVAIHDLNELGLSQKYNTLFAAYSPGTVGPPNSGKVAFNATLHQVLVVLTLDASVSSVRLLKTLITELQLQLWLTTNGLSVLIKLVIIQLWKKDAFALTQKEFAGLSSNNQQLITF